MPEQVVIEFLANTDGLQQGVTAVNQLDAAGVKLGADFKKSSDAMNAGLTGNTDKSKIAKVSMDQLSQSVKDLNKDVLGVGASSQQLKKFGDEIDKNVGQAKTLTGQLRQMKQELSQMETAGQAGSKSFEKLAIQAAKVEDQIGRTSQRIRTLASDTKYIDAAVNVVTGLAGAFSIAQGAAGLLGKENEDLQKALLKVQSSMAILNGLEAVSNTIRKTSAANIVGYGVALKVVEGIQRIFAVSSAAAWAIATGGITILIAGVVALIDVFSALNKEVEFQKQLQKDLKDLATQNDKEDNDRRVAVAERELEMARIRKASVSELYTLEVELNDAKQSFYVKQLTEKGALDAQDFANYQKLQDDRMLIDARYEESKVDSNVVIFNSNKKLIQSTKEAIVDIEELVNKQIQLNQELADEEALEAIVNRQIAIAESAKENLEVIVNAEIDAADRIKQIDDALAQSKLENQIAVAEKSGELANSLFAFGSAIRSAEMAEIEERQKRGLISEYRAAKEIAEIKRKQAISDKAQAIFNIILNTALAVAKVAGQTGVGSVVAIPLMIAIGAVQLATVIAQPIPKFAKGTESVKGGRPGVDSVPAILMPGERVVPAHINKQLAGISNIELPEMIRRAQYPDLPYISDATMTAMENFRMNGNGGMEIDYDKLADKMAERLGREIEKHPKVDINIDERGFQTRILRGSNEIKILDNHYSSKR